MARVILSGLVSDISGKIGGTTFQRTQGGLIARNQSAKINSNTARSNLRKVGMATVQNDWQTLTDTQRLLWNTYATYIGKKQKHNIGLNINGHQLFININSIRYDLSSVNSLFDPYLLSEPVLNPLPQAIGINAVTEGFGVLRPSFDREVDADTEVIILFASRPLKGSEQSSNQKMTLMKSPTLSHSYIDIQDYYLEVYGRLATAGEYIQVKAAIYSTTSQNYSSYSVLRTEII